MATKTLPYVRGPLRRAVLSYLCDRPGSTSEEIADGMTFNFRRANRRVAVSQVCQRLYNAGWLFRQRGGVGSRGQYICMLTPKATGGAAEGVRTADDRAIVPAPEPVAEPTFDFDNEPHVSKARHEHAMQQLHARINELARWKDEAIDRFPELAVDPLVLEARKIVADQCGDDGMYRSAFIDGGRDNSFAMRVALAALRVKQGEA